MTFEESKKAYMDYINNHIDNVSKAFDQYGDQLCSALEIDKSRLDSIVSIHDRSKYTDEEFDPYRAKFYPKNINQEDIELCFNDAWKHHYEHNPHHPEFWITKNDNGEVQYTDMAKLYIAEMLLDWAAMSMVKGGTACEYYYRKDGGLKKPFSQNTREIVERVINIFKSLKR